MFDLYVTFPAKEMYRPLSSAFFIRAVSEEKQCIIPLHLKEGDEISLYAMTTKKDGSGPYGWVDYVKLKQTKKAPEQWPVLKEISLEAENYAPEEKADYDTSPEGVVNLADPSYRLELPITLADGFPEEGDDYLFTMYTTGVMRSYEVEVNGQVVLSGERAGSGYELKNMTREVGESLIHLEPGDILAVSFLEQEEGNNWGNYIDRIVLNSNRKAPNREIGNRTGARIAVEAAESLLKHQGPSTGMEDGRLIYEGEAYYTKQNDNPAADLQPGENLSFYATQAADEAEADAMARSYLENRQTPDPAKDDLTTLLQGYRGVSIVDACILNGLDPSLENRATYAEAFGIENYRGTAEQNLFLLTSMGGVIE